MSSAEATQERSYYSEIADATSSGTEDFKVEEFIPCKGTLLCVIPPAKEETKGGIFLNEDVREKPSVGRVAAVPPNDPTCPVKVGDWVVTRYMEGQDVNFDGRKDLVILQYCDGPDSDIVGFFPNPE